MNELRINLTQAKTEEEKYPIEKRIARLTGGVAVIQVGGATETEMKERLDRFDDSVRATKSAISEGYVAGAGTSFIRIKSGNKIIDNAISMPLKQICYNAGLRENKRWQFWKPKDTFLQVKNNSGSIGYNAKTGKIENLLESGIIDPVKVLRCALQNAASAAGMLLTCEAEIVDTL